MKAWCYSYMYILYSFPHSWDPSIANIFLAESMRLHHPKTGNSNLLCFKFNACCTTDVGWLRSYFGSKLCHRYNKLSHALQVGWFAFLGSLTGFSLSFLIILLVPQIFGPRVATGADVVHWALWMIGPRRSWGLACLQGIPEGFQRVPEPMKPSPQWQVPYDISQTLAGGDKARWTASAATQLSLTCFLTQDTWCLRV